VPLNTNNSRPERLSGARSRGQVWLGASQLDQLVRCGQIRSANANIKVYRDAHGWVIDGAGGGGGICVVITSQVDYQHYVCSVYGNGYRDDTGTPVAATETGQALWIDQIAAGTTIPTGTRLRATKIGTHYEADVPRWL